MPTNTNELPRLISIGEAAEYLGVSKDTLRRWEREGKIVPFRTPGNQRRYSRALLNEILNKRQGGWEGRTTDTAKTPTPEGGAGVNGLTPPPADNLSPNDDLGQELTNQEEEIHTEKEEAWEEEPAEEESPVREPPETPQEEEQEEKEIRNLEESLEQTLAQAQQLKAQLVSEAQDTPLYEEAPVPPPAPDTSKTRLQRFYQPKTSLAATLKEAITNKLVVGIVAAILSLVILGIGMMIIQNYKILPPLQKAEFISPIPEK